MNASIALGILARAIDSDDNEAHEAVDFLQQFIDSVNYQWVSIQKAATEMEALSKYVWGRVEGIQQYTD